MWNLHGENKNLNISLKIQLSQPEWETLQKGKKRKKKNWKLSRLQVHASASCVCRLAVPALCNVTCFQKKKSVTAGPNYLNFSVTTNVPPSIRVPLLNEWVIKKRKKPPQNHKPMAFVPCSTVCFCSLQWSSVHVISLIRDQRIWSEKRALQN